MSKASLLITALTAALFFAAGAAMHDTKVKAHLAPIAGLLDSHPQLMIDLSAKSGEYCINTWTVDGAHMTHYAVEPSKTTEDVIDFVRVDSLAGAIDASKLPKAPAKLGAKKPNQWYHLPAGAYDPHHQTEFPFDLIVRATDIE